MDRREFIGSAAALPVAISALGATGATASPESETAFNPAEHIGPWIEVNRANLTWNVEQVSRRVGRRPILAVLKANAYGHGLAETAQHLETLKVVHGYAVFKPAEAFLLREAGLRKPILVLGPSSETELEEMVRLSIMPSVYEDRGKTLARLAARYQKPIKVHLYLDTGLGRMGVPYHRALPVVEALSKHKGVEFDGILTPLTEEDEFDREQLRRLQEIYDQAGAKGISLGLRHAASSAAALELPEASLDMVRPGIALYGCYPNERSRQAGEVELKPVMSLKARVMYVKQLRTGDSLQYHRAYVAKKPVWVATLPLGYSDGWLRGAANTCQALIRGRRYPLIAAVTSNHTLVELGEETSVEAGDEALLFGDAGEKGISPHEVSDRTKTSVYSLLIQMSALLPRLQR